MHRVVLRTLARQQSHNTFSRLSSRLTLGKSNNVLTSTSRTNTTPAHAVRRLHSSSLLVSSSGSDVSRSGTGIVAAPPSDESRDDELRTLQQQVEMDEDFLVKSTQEFTPRQVVQELNRFIVGQHDAKKAVAIALRNRYRRHLLPKEMKDEVSPKNILMIGPTGIGKTEIARRLAKIQGAPFIKVEATKFTEIGFHGRDVDQIIRDLVDNAIAQTKTLFVQKYREKLKKSVDSRILDLLTGDKGLTGTRKMFEEMLEKGLLESRTIDVEIPEAKNKSTLMESTGRAIAIGPMGLDVTQLLEGVKPRAKKQKVSVAEGRPIIEQTEIDRLLSTELIQKKAIKAVEQNGIVFLDEVDKICSPADAPPTRSDASAEGVQKDLLPMLEGTIINTRYGDVDTSKILWIASGAFQSVRPSDLMAEFQGRLPIRVELKPLTRDDLFRILTEPENNLLEQQRALLRTENIDLRFTEGAVREIARIASEVNASVQDIGARRLHTIIERVMEEINFECDKYVGTQVTVNEEHVRKQVGEMLVKNDISRYIL